MWRQGSSEDRAGIMGTWAQCMDMCGLMSMVEEEEVVAIERHACQDDEKVD